MNRILDDLTYIEGVLGIISGLGDDVFTRELANKTGFSRRVVDEARSKLHEIREIFMKDEAAENAS